MIRTVLFDAAGTLFDVARARRGDLRTIRAPEGSSAEPLVLDDAFRAAFAASTPLAFPHAPAGELASLERAWWRRLVFDAFARARVDTSPVALDSAFAGVFEHYATAAAWRTYADVKPVLRRLRDRGLRLGVVSNFDGRLRRLLDALGLASAFDAVVLSSECGFAKPDRRIFEAALCAIASPGRRHAARRRLRATRPSRRTEAGLAALQLDRRGVSSAAVITHLDQLVDRIFRIFRIFP